MKAPTQLKSTVAVLVGGPDDIYRELRAKLAYTCNIDVAHHRNWDKKAISFNLPAKVELVIVLNDMTSHAAFWMAKKIAKKRGCPLVVTQRKWAHMSQALAREGYPELKAETNVVPMFPERTVESVLVEPAEMTDMEKDLLSTKAAADLCEVSPSWLLALFNKGLIKATKQTGVKGLPHGSRLRFTMDQVEAAQTYIAANSRKRKKSASPPKVVKKVSKTVSVKISNKTAGPSLVDMDRLIESLQSMLPGGRRLVVTPSKYWFEK